MDTTAIDAVYAERDMVVALAARLAQLQGINVFVAPHIPASADEQWEEGWSSVIVIELPNASVSWHVKDSELPWFVHLPRQATHAYDGYTTQEKYQRLLDFAMNWATPRMLTE